MASGTEEDGELNLLLFILGMGVCNSAGSTAVRVIQSRSGDVYRSMLANYVVALLLAVGYCLWAGPFGETWARAVVMGVPTGVLYVTGLAFVMRNMGQRGLAMTSALLGMGLLMPSVLALALGESLAPVQGVGMAVSAAAIPLLSTSTVSGVSIRETPRWGTALLMFVISGCAASSNLLASKYCDKGSYPLYLVSLFATATIGSAVVRRLWGRQGRPGDVRRGAVCGVFNALLTLVVLFAVKDVGGAALFPGASVTALTLTTIVGVWWWRERLQRWGWIGLALAAAAVVLLYVRSP